VSAAAEADARVASDACNGCKHCHWIQPGRQQMNCLVLGRLEVVAKPSGDYLHTLIPKGCPQLEQPRLL
jgi:hypothetical protein